jgi:LPXTG-motif cell wall-anchored protein
VAAIGVATALSVSCLPTAGAEESIDPAGAEPVVAQSAVPTYEPSAAPTPDPSESPETDPEPEVLESQPPTTEQILDEPTKTTPATPSSDPATLAPAESGILAEDLGEPIVTPFIVGVPDGATAPYLYWEVKDTNGDPVGGATFSFERRSSGSWTGTRTVTDCVSGTCTVVDRDNDPGEYLVKWINSDNPGQNPTGTGAANVIQADSRYRIQPVNPPAGYAWVSSTGWVDSNTLSWSGGTNNRTLDFGEFTVQKINYLPLCDAGYIYAVSATGQMQQVAPGGAVTTIGTSASGVSNFNGLGIGPAGQPVYAIERNTNTGNSQNGTVWTYNTATGVWTSTGTNSGTTTTNLVGGAVNPTNSLYYFGGFTSAGTSFVIFQYNPTGTPRITTKGTVTTNAGTGANGDFAFDAAGNLYLTRGVGTSQTLFTVTAAAFNAGGTMTPTGSQSVTMTMSGDVNGVALDGSGRGILGSSAAAARYDLPNWSNTASVVSSGLNSTDLASCSFPPTITVEKYIEGTRINAAHQFTLNLLRGATNLGTATTTGSQSGLQAAQVGPLPIVRGVPLAFNETAATGVLNQYVSRYECRVDGGSPTVQGSGTSGSITIPDDGESVVCRFYNSRPTATVTIHKDVTGSAGQGPTARQGWTVGATATGSTGTVTQDPTAATQQTSTSGDAVWNLTFGNRDGRATVTVSEQMEAGYQFLRGECVITRLDGTTTTTTLTGAAAQQLTGIAPGDDVACTYVNSMRPATVTIAKQVQDITGQNPQPAAGWTVGATLSSPAAGITITTPATQSTQSNGQAPNPWTVGYAVGTTAANVNVRETMQTGYAFVSSTCVITAASGGATRTQNLNATDAVMTGLAPGESAVCTFVNRPQPGTVAWQKTDSATPAQHLAASQWKIVGPSPATTELSVTDCVAANDADCTDVDKDSRAGYFRVTGLAWGSYNLIETRPPAGFLLDATPRPFTVSATALTHTFASPFVNRQQAVPALPLTGGLSSDGFLIGGGALLLGAAGALLLLRRRRAET